MNDEKLFSRLSSRDRRYNSSKQGEGSFRVLYYGGATGSVPFLWESQPGTPKHKFSVGGPLPPLTPPPQYMSCPLASPSLKKKKKKKSHSKIMGSIFTRTPSKKSSAPAPTSPSSSSSSSSRSSSYSLPSTPFYSSSRARLRSKMEFEVGEDEYEEGADSPTSTLCFRSGNGSCSRRNNKGYDFFYPVKSLKKVVNSIAGGLHS